MMVGIVLVVIAAIRMVFRWRPWPLYEQTIDTAALGVSTVDERFATKMWAYCRYKNGHRLITGGSSEAIASRLQLAVINPPAPLLNILVSNFHSQFGRILQTASVDELIRRLREKGREG